MDIDTAIANFAGALRAIAPFLESCGIEFANDNQSDQFDSIAEELFRRLVLDGVAEVNPSKDFLYGFPKLNSSSYIAALDRASGNEIGKFRHITHGPGIFDTAVVDRDSSDPQFVYLPLSDIRFRVKEHY